MLEYIPFSFAKTQSQTKKGVSKLKYAIIQDEEAVMKGFDRLNALPNLIIHYIIFFLDKKYTTRTRILSRRWKVL